MAWAPLAFAIAGTVMSVVGQISAGQAQKRQAQAAQQAKEYEAAQAEVNAGQEMAAAQRRALDERRRATMLASRALAVGAASGAGTSGSVEEIISDIAGEGSYRAALQIYGGEDRARRLQAGAAGARYEGDSLASFGRSQATGSYIGALGRGISGGYSLYDKYGRGGPSAAASSGGAGAYPDAGSSMDPRFS
jgi:hypothetical protein